MIDHRMRSLAKAISWRITGTLDTFVISLIITGELILASGIAATEIMTKILLYWAHERVWNRISWGRGVGYTAGEETFDESITSISATNIRKEMGL